MMSTGSTGASAVSNDKSGIMRTFGFQRLYIILTQQISYQGLLKQVD